MSGAFTISHSVIYTAIKMIIANDDGLGIKKRLSIRDLHAYSNT